VVFEAVSSGRDNRRQDELEKVVEYEATPPILRYVVVESESRSFRAFWRKPGEGVWQREQTDTIGLLWLPEFGLELTFDEIYAGVELGLGTVVP
jgi:Uma2 family endonuclease